MTERMSDAAPHQLRHIVLTDVPARLLLESQDHLDELVRELRIVAIGIESGTAQDVPARLAALLGELLRRYETVRTVNRTTAMRELEAGRDTVTLEMELPVDAADDVRRALEVLEEADALCREGDLLTLASREDVSALRRRLAEQVLRQLEV